MLGSARARGTGGRSPSPPRTHRADARPTTARFRGCFHFGSAPDSLRFRHIRRRPQVSATHLPGEDLAVTVHGRAIVVDARSEQAAEFRHALLGVYVPRYGAEWEQFLDSGPVYARIEAERMFAFAIRPTRESVAVLA